MPKSVNILFPTKSASAWRDKAFAVCLETPAGSRRDLPDPSGRRRSSRAWLPLLLCLANLCPAAALNAQQAAPAGSVPPADAVASAVSKDQFIQQLSGPAPLPAGVRTRGINVGTRKPQAVSVQILFKSGSAEVADGASLRQLREAGEALKSEALASYRFKIEGHTDNVGNPDYNLQLSRQRAASIVDYLHNQYGIATERLSAVGKGQTEPIEDNGTETGRAKNRRVVFMRQE